jgi:tRNA uridine 5-carboxymethylaminomethyl modification enzyme
LLSQDVIDKVEIRVKFDGYIKNQEKYINKWKKYESIDLSSIQDYKKIKNLSLEAIDKLNKIRPLTLGQAERISGINMPDLIVIKYFLEQNE